MVSSGADEGNKNGYYAGVTHNQISRAICE